MTKTEKALSLFGSSYNCAQAILAAYGPDFGLDETMALKLSSVFGSGIARTGSTCGAVSGALMVMSLRYCDAKPKGMLQKPVHKKARKLIETFEHESGSLNCNALRGFDPLKGKYIKGNNGRCAGYVELACRLLEELL